jgi:membrane protein required for colicin V production
MSQASAAHAADIIIIAFLVISALIGVVSGFTKLFLNIVAWGSAVTLAIVFASHIQPFFFQFIPYTLPSTIIAASLIFVVTLSVLIYISSSLGRVIKSSALSGLDRSLGLILGMCLGTFMVSGIFNFMPTLLSKEKYDNLIANAKLGHIFQEASKYSRLIAGSLISNQLLDSFLTLPNIQPSPATSNQQQSPPSHQLKGYDGEERNQIDQLLQEELEPKPEENLIPSATGNPQDSTEGSTSNKQDSEPLLISKT